MAEPLCRPVVEPPKAIGFRRIEVEHVPQVRVDELLGELKVMSRPIQRRPLGDRDQIGVQPQIDDLRVVRVVAAHHAAVSQVEIGHAAGSQLRSGVFGSVVRVGGIRGVRLSLDNYRRVLSYGFGAATLGSGS